MVGERFDISERPLLRETDAAQALGVSPRTLQKWRWNGKGPKFIRLNGAVRYDTADIESFVSGARRSSTSDPGILVSVKEAA
jgi:predicted site-specific integrase-resolvase